MEFVFGLQFNGLSNRLGRCMSLVWSAWIAVLLHAAKCVDSNRVIIAVSNDLLIHISWCSAPLVTPHRLSDLPENTHWVHGAMQARRCKTA